MKNSILNDVKKLIGPSVSYHVFDPDLIININSAFFTLFQLGIGDSRRAFSILDDRAVWRDFSSDKSIIAAAKQYVYLKVRVIFDPPTSSFVLQTYQDQIQELEWRLREMGSGSFDDDEEAPIASRKKLGYVIVGEFFNVEDGRISVDRVMPITRKFLDEMLFRVFGPEDETEEEESEMMNIDLEEEETEPGEDEFDPDDPENEEPNDEEEDDVDCCCGYDIDYPVASRSRAGVVSIGHGVDVDEDGRISVRRGDIIRVSKLHKMLDRVFGSERRRSCAPTRW